MKQPAVYILASKRNGTLYIGVTSNLASRIEAHRAGTVEGFTKEYDVHQLVYFELHEEMYEAIQREKRLKKWIERGRSASSRKRIPSGGIFQVRSIKKLGSRLRGNDEI